MELEELSWSVSAAAASRLLEHMPESPVKADFVHMCTELSNAAWD